MAGNLEKVLRLMAERRASDVFLSDGSPAQIKIHGTIMPISDQVLRGDQIRMLMSEVLTREQLQTFDQQSELNTSLHLSGVGGFRLSVFRQRGQMAAVMRCIPDVIPSLKTLGVPEFLSDLVMEKRGLVLMVGATGSGKSTTLAAMLEHRNQNAAGHILTLEDPVEYLFSHKLSVVNQREVGRDTESMAVALRNAMRQAPDVIMIGEIRDRESMTAALSYALSGHLVLATLHANNADHAIGRVISFYPPEVREGIRADLAAALKAIIAQRLLRATAGGRVPAVEVLRNTKLVSDLIEKGDLLQLKEAIEKSTAEGSQSFDQDLARLVRAGTVTRDEAVTHADSPANLVWRLQNDIQSPLIGADHSASEELGNDRSQDPPEIQTFTVDVRIQRPRLNISFPSLN
jgi:twitching motility protein PilU